MDYVLVFLVGAMVGAAVALILSAVRARRADAQLRESFTALAAEALDASSKRLAEQAGAVLDGKKALVDQTFTAMQERLEQVRTTLQRVETERKQDFGRLSGAVSQLATTAGELHRVLASTQRRGAWGERMAEDVLRLAGLEEGTNYRKQSAEAAGGGDRPDFTFLLPNNLLVNMDVKFPLEDYKAYLDADTEAERSDCLKALTAAVRRHVRDVAGRGYIDPKAPTVPYVIVFVASEQMYSLVLSAGPDLMDDALRQKVVLCSPLTLYAMLAVIRQAAENANIARTADQIVALVAEFSRQWALYNQEMDKLGRHLRQTQEQFDLVRMTRSNVLQRVTDKIEGLRTRSALPEGTEEDKPGALK